MSRAARGPPVGSGPVTVWPQTPWERSSSGPTSRRTIVEAGGQGSRVEATGASAGLSNCIMDDAPVRCAQSRRFCTEPAGGGMASRRQFLGSCVAAALWPALGFARSTAAVQPPAGPQPQRLYKVIYDRRYSASSAFAEWMERQGIPTRSLDRGDVTNVWFNDLALRWRRSPAAIAGMTAPEALFCLQELARDHGMRVTFSADHRLRSDGSIEHRLRGAVIGPRDAAAAKHEPAWVERMAELALRSPRTRPVLAAEPLVVLGNGSARHAPPPGSLVSWVIAPLGPRARRLESAERIPRA